MKKIIKSRIFYFILGALIFSSVTVLASQILARDISYTRNGVTTNVESALNDLYDKANEPLINKLDLTSDYVYSIGYRTGPKTVSINLNPGSYFIVFTSGYAWNSGAWTPTINNNIEEAMNNNNCTSIIQKKLVNYVDGNANFTGTAVYKCNFLTADTVSFSHSHSAADGMSENILLYSIKIS